VLAQPAGAAARASGRPAWPWLARCVKLFEVPARGMRFLQLGPVIPVRVVQGGGYAGLSLALPYILYEVLAFVLPGLTAGGNGGWWHGGAVSAVLFLA